MVNWELMETETYLITDEALLYLRLGSWGSMTATSRLMMVEHGKLMALEWKHHFDRQWRGYSGAYA